MAVWDGVEFASVEDAVAVAERGGEVLVCPGRHDTQLELPGGSQLILSSWSGDPEATVLTGGGTHRIILVEPGSSLTVRGLGFEDGYTDTASPTYTFWAGAAIMAEDSDLVMESCVVRGNNTLDHGGDVSVYMAQDSDWESRELTVRDCQFEDSGGEYASALSYYTQGVGGEGHVTIEDCTFQDNSVGGGVVTLFGAHNPDADFIAMVDSCTFTGNNANSTLGIRHDGESGSLTVSDCSFDSNNAVWGAVYGPDAQNEQVVLELMIANSSFIGNSSTYGGALSFHEMPQLAVAIQDSHFEGNTSSSSTAGGGYYGAAIDIFRLVQTASLTLIRTSLHTNSSAGLAAVGVTSWTELQADEVDWGTGSLDNSPADLCVGQDDSYTCNADLGASETFECPGVGTCDW